MVDETTRWVIWRQSHWAHEFMGLVARFDKAMQSSDSVQTHKLDHQGCFGLLSTCLHE
jgi:hypothetical protein